MFCVFTVLERCHTSVFAEKADEVGSIVKIELFRNFRNGKVGIDQHSFGLREYPVLKVKFGIDPYAFLHHFIQVIGGDA